MIKKRKRHPPETVRKCLVDVFVNEKSSTQAAIDHGVEFWTLQHWMQNAKKHGLEATVLSFYRKPELINLLIDLKKDR